MESFSVPTRVSIAMATYNGERFIAPQLASLAQQTLLPYELVICDDGSTDGTMDQLRQFQEQAPFQVRIYQNASRLGYVSNFMKALSHCDGDVVSFCDQDDVWLAHKLSTVTLRMDRAKSVLVVHAAKVVDGDLDPRGGDLPRIVRDQTVKPRVLGDGPLRSFPLGFCLTFRREVADWVILRMKDYPSSFSHYFGHEMPIYLAARALGQVSYMSEPLALYRRHGGNSSQGARPTSHRDALHQGAQQYDQYATHQMLRRDFLKWLARVGEPRTAENQYLLRLSEISADHAILLSRRSALYRERKPSRRLSQLMALAINRGYRPRLYGGLGMRSFIKDLASVLHRS